MRRSIDLFQGAIARDPGFARAHSNLAAAYVLLPAYAEEVSEVAFPMASEAALQALTIDETLAEAHAVLAEINRAKWAWTDAETAFFFATSLDPNEPTPRHWYSTHLRESGRLQAALEQALLALELDPDSPVINANMAEMYYVLGRDEEAIRYAELTISLGFWRDLNGLKAAVYLRREQWDAARTELTQWFPAEPGAADAYVRTVKTGQGVVEISAQMAGQPTPGNERLVALAVLRQWDLVFDIAEQLSDDRTLVISNLWAPELAELRRHPRFATLVERIGLLDYWKRYGWPDNCTPEDGGFSCS